MASRSANPQKQADRMRRIYLFTLVIIMTAISVTHAQMMQHSGPPPLSMSSVSDTTATNQWAWYNSSGKKVTFKKVVRKAMDNQIILFGELHNDRICHALQLGLYTELIQQKAGKVVLGMEMLERHQQSGIDSFLNGHYTDSALMKTHKLWPNHKSDYQPLIWMAKANQLKCIATNVPRKYARLVSKLGPSALDTLSSEEKRLMCPLPYVVDTMLNCYKQLLTMGHGDQFNGYYFASAQALKDASMAHFILENWNEGEVFLHLNGAYHSDFHESIVWYLNQKNPKLKILVISTTESETLIPEDKNEFKKGDFILVTHPNNPKSYKD